MSSKKKPSPYRGIGSRSLVGWVDLSGILGETFAKRSEPVRGRSSLLVHGDRKRYKGMGRVATKPQKLRGSLQALIASQIAQQKKEKGIQGKLLEMAMVPPEPSLILKAAPKDILSLSRGKE